VQHSTARTFWVTSDGTKAACLRPSGMDLDETVALRICFDEHWRHAPFNLSPRTLSEVIATELGFTVEIES